MGCGCGPRWPLHINTHGDSGEYHSGHKWHLRPMTTDVASYVRLRRGRSVIWIVAPGCESLCHTPSGEPGGVKGSWTSAGQVKCRPRPGQVLARDRIGPG